MSQAAGSRARRALLGALLLLLLAAAAGPRPRVSEPPADPPTFPADLDAWLEQSEAAVGDVVPTALKQIRWLEGRRGTRTRNVVVYLHGFSATRQETAPLADSVAARLDAHLFLTRLRGHGRPGDALADVQAGDWLADAAEAMAVAERLGDRVHVIGTSTGATLATWMAASGRWSESLVGLALLSPNYEVADPGARLLLLPWGGLIARLIVGEYRSWTPANPEQGRYWTTRYPTRALLPMMALVQHVRRMDPATLEVPVWMGYSPEDEVISAPRVEEVFRSWRGEPKTLVTVDDVGDPSHHILAGDVLSPGTTPRLIQEIAGFFRALDAGAPPAGSDPSLR